MNSASLTSFMREPFPTFPGTAKEMKRSFSFLFWSAKVAFVDDEKCNLPYFSFFYEAKVYFLQVFTSAMNHSIYLSLGCWNISGNLSPDLVYLSKIHVHGHSPICLFLLDSNFLFVRKTFLITATIVYCSCQKKSYKR